MGGTGGRGGWEGGRGGRGGGGEGVIRNGAFGIRNWKNQRESTLVQPRRHHSFRLQQSGSILLGRLRLPARRRRRYAARSRSQLLQGGGRAAALQDRMDSRPGWRNARDLRISATARCGS